MANPPSIEEYLRTHKGMSREEAAKLDAETPPFEPETDPGMMTILRQTDDDGNPIIRGPAKKMPNIRC